MRSDELLAAYKSRFSTILALPIQTPKEKEAFLRQYLSLLDKFLYERPPPSEIDDPNSPDSDQNSYFGSQDELQQAVREVVRDPNRSRDHRMAVHLKFLDSLRGAA